jgi:hypothetical protein
VSRFKACSTNAADGFTAEQIAREIYDLDVDVVRRMLQC